jgi:hypothetical protein
MWAGPASRQTADEYELLIFVRHDELGVLHVIALVLVRTVAASGRLRILKVVADPLGHKVRESHVPPLLARLAVDG